MNKTSLWINNCLVDLQDKVELDQLNSPDAVEYTA